MLHFATTIDAVVYSSSSVIFNIVECTVTSSSDGFVLSTLLLKWHKTIFGKNTVVYFILMLCESVHIHSMVLMETLASYLYMYVNQWIFCYSK